MTARDILRQKAPGHRTGTMASTRKQWWLIGHPEENITGSRLPSKGQVLRKFYFHHGLENKTKAEAAKEAVEGVLEIWEKAGLPTSTLRYSKAKLLKLVEAYEDLQKHKKRVSETARMKEEIFKGDLDDLFDVAHRDACEKTTNDEDRAFIISQRENRSTSSMTGLDIVSLRIQEKKRKREEEDMKRKKAAEMEKKIFSSIVPSSQVASSSSSSHGETDSNDAEFKCQSPPKRRAITREEAQKQYLLKVVAKDRRECPTTSKAALLEPEQSDPV